MDRRAIDEFGIPGIILMENAALRVVEFLEQEHGPLTGCRVAVLCGKGNNGGDGLAIARHLHCRFNAVVRVYLLADPDEMKGDAAANYTMAERCGVPITLCPADAPVAPARAFGAADFVVDALFGTGFTGAATGLAGSYIESANKSGRPIIAVDVPSGVNADNGRVEGAAIRASSTITFGLTKIGLLLHPAAEYTGKLVVGDIGFPRSVMEGGSLSATEAADVVAWLPSRAATRDANKGKFGHATIFAGSAGFLGAANLSASGAARSGSGLVTLCVPEGILDAAMVTANPIVMTRGLAQTSTRSYASQALDDALALAAKGTAAAIGPGVGREDADTVKFVCEFIKRCPAPLVIDADALTILSEQPGRGADIVNARVHPTILTPHPGEMSRLLGIKTQEVQDDRLGAVRSAAQHYNCTVLLKGARTLIASPDGRLSVNTTGNTGMASGGMGDTLTGITAALLGMKLGAHEAAAAAACIHGLAGDIASDRIRGQAGLLASDLIEAIPEAIARCVEAGPAEERR